MSASSMDAKRCCMFGGVAAMPKGVVDRERDDGGELAANKEWEGYWFLGEKPESPLSGSRGLLSSVAPVFILDRS
jgi:hypothetical protein